MCSTDLAHNGAFSNNLHCLDPYLDFFAVVFYSIKDANVDESMFSVLEITSDNLTTDS
jgi:hypothetical protein